MLVPGLVLAACGGGSGQPSVGPPYTLKVAAVAAGPFTQNFNPLLIDSGNANGYATKAIYEPLLQDDFVKGVSRPWLVSSFSWDDAGRTLTLKLRGGVRWSDGQPFTAEDVAFTFDLVRRYAAFDLYSLPIATTSAPTPDTAVITFSHPAYQAMWWRQVVVPKHVWSAIADPVRYTGVDSVGTGPYLFKSFTPQVITLVRNPYYWRPQPSPIRTVQYLSFDSVDSMLAAFESGQLDWVGTSAIDPRPIAQHDAAHIGYWVTKPSNAIVVLMPNDAAYPLSLPEVRQAISLALDRQAISRISSLGQNAPMTSPTGLDVTGGSALIDPAYRDLRYGSAQPAAAKRLLAAAGFRPGSDGVFAGPDGRALHLQLLLPTSNPYGDFVRASRVIVDELRQAGIALDIKTESQVAWRTDTNLGSYQLTVRALGGTLDTYDLFNRIFTQEQLVPVGKSALLNFERYRSAQAGALLQDYAASAPGSPDEARARAGLEKLMVDDAPVIPVFFTSAVGLYRNNHATGFPSGSDPYAVPVPDSANPTLVLAQIRATGR
jgi:peptide/nickel transport system substrate-binding protein